MSTKISASDPLYILVNSTKRLCYQRSDNMGNRCAWHTGCKYSNFFAYALLAVIKRTGNRKIYCVVIYYLLAGGGCHDNSFYVFKDKNM
jgi:hypothetical protein